MNIKTLRVNARPLGAAGAGDALQHLLEFLVNPQTMVKCIEKAVIL